MVASGHIAFHYRKAAKCARVRSDTPPGAGWKPARGPGFVARPGQCIAGGCVGMQATKPPRRGGPAGLDRAAAVYCPGQTRVPDPINLPTPDDVAPRPPSVA